MTPELEKQSRLINAQHGGARAGAGRKKGSHGKLTKAVREKALQTGDSPLDVLLSIMRQPEPVREAGESVVTFLARYKLWIEYRFEAAKAAAPYIHPRSQAVEPTGKAEKPTVMEHRFEFVVVKTPAEEAQHQTPGLLQ